MHEDEAAARRDVAIIGAGPVGLDAALGFADAGHPVTVYEAGAAVAAHVRAWGHVRLFTPWQLTLSPRMRTHLTRAGHALPPEEACPTGHQFAARVLEPLANLPLIAGRIRFGHRVAAVARDGLLKHEHIGSQARATASFRLLVEGPEGERIDHADLVLDCSGTHAVPNTLGDGGIPAPGERALAHRITRTLPPLDDLDDLDDPDATDDPGGPAAWRGTVLLVGAGKSAQTAARDLAALPDTRLEWVIRDPCPSWGEVVDDPLPDRQQLVDSSRALAAGANDGGTSRAPGARGRVTVRTGARVTALHPDGARVRVALATAEGPAEIVAEHVLALTGYTGDATLYRQLQVHECYATAAPMNLSATLLGSAAGGDCLAQPALGLDALRTPEPHFFILGAKSYGRLNTFLLRAGYEHVDQVLSAYTPTATAVPRGAQP